MLNYLTNYFQRIVYDSKLFELLIKLVPVLLRNDVPIQVHEAEQLIHQNVNLVSLHKSRILDIRHRL